MLEVGHRRGVLLVDLRQFDLGDDLPRLDPVALVDRYRFQVPAHFAVERRHGKRAHVGEQGNRALRGALLDRHHLDPGTDLGRRTRASRAAATSWLRVTWK